ncbi:TonB-linked outer membrane protein, SusC/RagA family [Mariniphaga anaerophila]|uniref:TonB-linked outer membrane protein, SusC/RagA family n=1 Tax=Mariniphaga anaerophila TaxID=1484053 RepID=A0A1M4UBW8_9BACT|nr:TonB-dependent receptor [Mariniphaga anaerophila]SHE54302.1 TonB-linked outer membrane protein, SusC/RagA family [Mariniphaga anaerophila]
MKRKNQILFRKLSLLLIAILMVSFSWAQQKSISGKVTDASSEPLPGVTIVIKGTTQGTVTGMDGTYSISNIPEGGTLQFSFVGMTTQEIQVGNETTINVTLVADAIGIEEVVAIGYGVVRKSDLTGSVAQVTFTDQNTKPITSADQLLQGKVSGVQVIQSSGAPGAGMGFQIRGGNSLGSNQPLIVLDGYPIDANSGGNSLGGDYSVNQQPQNNPLANINPNEIETIEILKDASSTAIYGSRGANGVVLITTKRGKKGRDQVEFNYRMDVAQMSNKIDVLNTPDFINYANEGALNDGVDPIYDQAAIDTISSVNYNWQDEIYRTAITHDYQLRFSGGDDRSNYSIIGSYLDQQGTIKNSDFTRGGLRFNYDRKVFDNLNIKLNVFTSKSKSNISLNSGTEGLSSANLVTSALLALPFQKGYNDSGEIDQTTTENPLTLLELTKDLQENTLIIANTQIDLKLTNDLTLVSNIGVNNNDGIRQSYYPRGTFTGDNYKGYAYRNQSTVFNFLSENTLNFVKDFGDHSINAVAGYSWQQWNRRSIGVSATDFSNDNLTYESFQSGNAPGTAYTQHREWALSSFLGRINYSYMNRYLLTATARYDGSTRLAEGNKWALFPSVAAAWKLHNESFMADAEIINTLKLRASYGTSGNQSIGVGSTKVLLGSDAYVVNGGIVKGLIKNNMANTTLGWETTAQYNVGMDLGLWNERIQLEVNLYKKKTEDLLINLPIPTTTGFRRLPSNAGSVENKGLDIDLRAQIIESPFRWSAGGNISFNRNKMLSLGELGDDGIIFGPNFLNAGNLLGQPIHVAIVGSPVGSFYGYRTDGIYQNAQEVAEGPQATSAKPGDIRIVDQNDDDKINGDDRIIIGNPHPDFTFGLTNNFEYKNFNLSFLILGVVGNDIANLNRYRMDPLTGAISNVRQEAYDNRWTGEGTSNYYPRASSYYNYFDQRFTDFIVEDGSYIRLKNVNLSYNIDVKANWIKSITVFASASNLLTISKYKGYDPEVSANYGTGLTPGVDNGTYPQSITVSTGLNIKF